MERKLQVTIFRDFGLLISDRKQDKQNQQQQRQRVGKYFNHIAQQTAFLISVDIDCTNN
jgi:hypothetical protein